jgi:hypothetical protein
MSLLKVPVIRLKIPVTDSQNICQREKQSILWFCSFYIARIGAEGMGFGTILFIDRFNLLPPTRYLNVSFDVVIIGIKPRAVQPIGSNPYSSSETGFSQVSVKNER